jgi:predicted nucleic acid-binding protein
MNVDSNIIIAYLDGDKNVIDFLHTWKSVGNSLLISAVVESEVLSFSKWNETERRNTETFLSDNFVLISFDRTLARIAAGIRREAKLKFPDAAIAATSIFTRTPLVTRNVRDFNKIKNLEIVKI